MAQAATIIPFPSNKLTFAAMKIDVDKVLASYDRNRAFVAVATQLLTFSPKKMRSRAVAMDKKVPGAAPGLIEDFERLSKDFAAMSEMLDAAAARLTAGHRNLL